MIGLHHIISLFIYSLISFFNRKNNPHFHPSSYVGTLTSFLTSSSALELAFPSDAERCFFTPTTYHRCLKYLTKAGCSTISLSAPKPETYLTQLAAYMHIKLQAFHLKKNTTHKTLRSLAVY